MITTGLNLLIPHLHTTGMIRTLTCLFIFHSLLYHHHNLQSNQKIKMRNCALNIKEQKRKFEPITDDYYIDSHGHMPGCPLACLHQGETWPATVAVTIERKTPASHPAQAPLTDLQHHIKVMRLNRTTRLTFSSQTHLLMFHSHPNQLSLLMLLGIPMMPYLMMVLPTWLK